MHAYNTELNRLKSSGLTAREAAATIAREQPQLRADFVTAANAQHPKPTTQPASSEYWGKVHALCREGKTRKEAMDTVNRDSELRQKMIAEQNTRR